MEDTLSVVIKAVVSMSFETTTADCYILLLVWFEDILDILSNIGEGLVKVVRSVKISPASRILAAAGDAKVIALYDVASGEQIGILNGHTSWIMSLDWSNTGEFLLSGYV